MPVFDPVVFDFGAFDVALPDGIAVAASDTSPLIEASPMSRTSHHTVYRGEDTPVDVTVYESNDADADPLDISGYTLRFVVAAKQNADEADNLIDLPAVVVDGAAGTAQAVIEAADLEAIDPVAAWFTVWRTDSGFRTVLATGRFTVAASVRVA